MSWYRVTKTIHGRKYDYWQRTERQGKSTKTYNKYIGPSTAGQATITSGQWNAQENALRAAKQTFSHLDCPDCQQERREYGGWRCSRHYNEAEDNARAIRQTGVGISKADTSYFHDPLWHEEHGMGGSDTESFKPTVIDKAERAEDERIQYASLKARKARQEAAVRAAKRKSRGTGASNPFLGQAIQQQSLTYPTCYLCGKETPSLNSANLCAECAE
jgi:hypothetical protein